MRYWLWVLCFSLSLATSGWAQQPEDALILVTNQSCASPRSLQAVKQAMSWLPASFKERLQKGGVTISLLPPAQDSNGVEGGSRYEPKNHQVVIAAGLTPLAQRRLPVTTLHELGHAYDWLLDHYSRTPEFMERYARELPHVKAQDRQLLAHFLQPGRKGPAECFASLFACKYFPGHDKRLDALKANFPQTFQLVQALQD